MLRAGFEPTIYEKLSKSCNLIGFFLQQFLQFSCSFRTLCNNLLFSKQNVFLHFLKVKTHNIINIFVFSRYAKHRWSPSYVTYYCMWFRLFATALVPLISLIYCNAKILIYYRENNFTRAFNVLQKKNQNSR